MGIDEISSKDKDAWLQKLVAGDKVIVHTRMNERMGIVDRVTKTMVILKGRTHRYSRAHGAMIQKTGQFHGTYLYEATPEQLAKIHRDERQQRLTELFECTDLNTLQLNTLERLITIYEKQKKYKEKQVQANR